MTVRRDQRILSVLPKVCRNPTQTSGLSIPLVLTAQVQYAPNTQQGPSMTSQAVFLRSTAAASDSASLSAPRRWLVVEPLPTMGVKVPFTTWDRVVHAQFENVGLQLLNSFDPEIVLAPLIAPRWDVMDLAALLTEARFGGLLLARSRGLPSVDMVLGEIRDMFPDIEVRIQIVPG
jgi:hypothetical protein